MARVTRPRLASVQQAAPSAQPQQQQQQQQQGAQSPATPALARVGSQSALARVGSKGQLARVGSKGALTQTSAIAAAAHVRTRLTNEEVAAIRSQTRFSAEECRLVAAQFVDNSSDKSLDGELSPAAFGRCMEVFGVRDSIVALMFRVFDLDGDQALDFSEFVVTLNTFLKGSFEEKVEYIWDLFDADGNGTLSLEEVRRMLSTVQLSSTRTIDADSRALFEKLDVDGNSDITFEEFARGINRLPMMMKMYHRCFGEE